MIITRHIINNNIKFGSYSDLHSDRYGERNYDFFNKYTNLFKNYLESINCKKGETVLIGFHPSVLQYALLMACCELGMVIIIHDYSRYDKWEKTFEIDPKTRKLMPINYFFIWGDSTADAFINKNKHSFFTNLSGKTIGIWDILENYNNFEENNNINVDKNDIIIKCVTSGTINEPKVVTHTHGFIYNLSNRNKTQFDKKVGVIHNLNHGSSIATFFLPALMSESVSHITSVGIRDVLSEKELTYKKLNDIDHILIPYYDKLKLLVTTHDLPHLTYYTLSTIDQELVDNKVGKKYKDIISIFGSNETSGPTLLNKATDKNFKPEIYSKVDDYYEILSVNPFTVLLKEYNKIINTKDSFLQLEDGRYKFLGRSDLIRINEIEIPTEEYSNIVKNIFNDTADIVYDTLYNKIYLALWEDIENVSVKIENLNSQLHELHYVSNYKKLNKSQFVNGVKLDQEFLRSSFRKKVEEYA